MYRETFTGEFMNFEERNASWTGAQRNFLQFHSRSGTPRFWSIQVVGNLINTWWGQHGGALQTATEHMQGVNLGKKNEKTPEVYALERAREMCRKKNWEGYREVGVDGQPLDPVVKADIDFENLPLSLCFYKPDNSMGAGITKKAESGQVFYTRKANGMMYVIARGQGRPKLYSRRMLRQHDDEQGGPLTWDDRFPHLVSAAEQFMPPNSIILGELVVFRPDGSEDFKHVQSITKSLTQQSLTDQAAGGFPSFYCWDIAFWEGQDLVRTAPVKDRYDLIHEVLEAPGFIPVELYTPGYFPTPSHAISHAKARKWEGFVVVDPDGIYGDKGYNFKGKPDRPGSFCAKLKPAYEDDFIAIWDPEKGHGERSTKGRSNQGIKAVALFQLNSKGEMVYISNVSSGLTDEAKKTWANPQLYPQVWKVEYTDRRYKAQGDDTNALDFARFIEVRTDKNPEECINTEL
jgi:hypothetical protein